TGLFRRKHAQGRARVNARRLHPGDHRRHLGDVAVLGAAPGRAHAEARGPGRLGLAGLLQHLFGVHQLRGLDPGVVALGLRAVAAVLGAAAGRDRQEGRNLHLRRVEVFTVHAGGAVQQLRQRQVEQGEQFLAAPVVADFRRHWAMFPDGGGKRRRAVWKSTPRLSTRRCTSRFTSPSPAHGAPSPAGSAPPCSRPAACCAGSRAPAATTFAPPAAVPCHATTAPARAARSRSRSPVPAAVACAASPWCMPAAPPSSTRPRSTSSSPATSSTTTWPPAACWRR